MKMFNRILLSVVIIFTTVSSYAQIDPFAAAVWMVGSGFSDQFYNVKSSSVGGFSAQANAIDPGSGCWNCASDIFDGQDFGSHISGASTIRLRGGEVKTIRDFTKHNVCSPELFYRVFTTGTSVSDRPSFTRVNLGHFANCSGGTYDDGKGPCSTAGSTSNWQKWQEGSYNFDLTNRNEGDYQIEVYFRIDGNNSGTSGCTDGIDYINDGANNYIASFKICPSATFDDSSNPTTCGGNGTITMNVVGVADGTYNNSNFYYGPVADGTTFDSVEVVGGVATITAPAGSYTDIRYYKTSGCSPTTGFDVTLSDPAPPALPTGSAAQSFCSIDSPTIANLTVTGNDIKWYDAATNGTQLATTDALVNGTSYFASQTDAITGCESARLEVVATVADPAAPGGDATQSFCSIDNPTVANLTATGTSIQWYLAPTGGSPLATNTALTTATNYYASQTVAGCESDTRFEVAVTVADPVAPGGDAAQSFCSIDNPTVASLTATGTSIQWYLAPTGGSPLATNTALTTATNYYASQTVAGCESDTRFEVAVTVADPAAPGGDAAQSFCSIDNPTVANLTATGAGIQWYAAATGGSALVTTTALSNGTTYYATQTVAGCESDTRFAVTVTIADPTAPTGNAAQSFCSIDNPTVVDLTATGTAIQWYAAATGGSPLAGGTALSDGTTYYATQTVAGCESDTRFAVTATVADPAAPTGSATQDFCSIDNPTVADLVASGTSIQWYTVATGGTALATTDALATGNYYASQTVAGCESDTRLTVAVTVADPAAPTGDAAQSFCSIDSPTVADLVATGTAVQWYAAATGGSALATSASLTNATTYYASQTVAGCESDTRLAVVVTVADPAAPTGSAAQSFCSIDAPTVADLAATGTSIQWYAASTGGSALATTDALTDATTYYATQTVGGCESDTRFAVTVTLNDNAPTGDTTQDFCSITSPTIADLVATGTSIQWYAAATGGTALAGATGLTTGTTYYASQTTGGCESLTRLAVLVTIVNPSIPTGNAAQSFCTIDNPTVADLEATGAGIQWYAAAAGGSPLATTTALVSGTTYYASQTMGCESATRFAVTATIADPTAPTGDAAQSFCSIDNPTVADLTTATGTAIQWYAVATGGTALATTTALTTGTNYYASQTVAGCESDTRLVVAVTVADPAAPTGSAAQSFCTINSPTVADLAATGVSIQWYAAATGGTALATTTALSNGVTYYASQTVGGCESDTRFAVTVTIDDPAAPTGSAAQSFCSIDNPTVADLTASGIAVQWYAAATGGTALATTTALTTATNYYASQTVGGCESDTRLVVAVTVADPSAPTGSAAQSFCSIDSPTVANLAATGAGVQWYAAATGGTALATTTALTTATNYYASQTVGGCESDTRLVVAVTVADPSAPTGSAAQSFCSIDSPTVANLAATGAGVQWYTTATGGTALATTASITNGTTYYATQTVGGCESDTRFAVVVTVADPAAPTGSAAQSFCSIDNPTVADLTATGTGVQWYTAATGGTALATTASITNGTTYYATQTVGGCESDTRFAVAVTVADPAAPTGSAAQSFCSIDNPTVADLTATGTGVQWYAGVTGGTALATTASITNGTTYYATQTVGGCESDTRFAVAVTVEDPAAPTGSVAQSFCSIDNPTVAELVATGSSIQWYAAASGGSALATTTALTNATTYYATQTVGGCESDTRFAVTVTIADPAAPAGDAAQSFCSIDNPTVGDLTATGTSIQWYSASTGGAALATNTLLVDATTYYASQTVGGCESDTRLAVVVTVNDPAAPTGSAAQSFCSIDSPTVADLTATGTAIQWYSAATGGAVLATTVSLLDGTTYYASQTIGGCQSDTRLAVTVSISDPSEPTGDAAQTFCKINVPTVADLVATGSGIQWYAANSGGSVLATTDALVDGTTYYASQTVTGCESISRFAVTVTLTDSAPTGDATQEFCSVSSSKVADLSVTGFAIKWYPTATGGAPLNADDNLVSGSTYYASNTQGGCESLTRFAVTVTIVDPNTPTGEPNQSFCLIDNPTVADLDASGAGIQWYAAPTGGTPLAATTALVSGDKYYASQTMGCESAFRLEVTVTIEDPSAPTGDATQDFCRIDNPTVADLVATGSSIIWYDVLTGGTQLASTTDLVNGVTYYASQTVGGCESSARLAVSVSVGNPARPTGDANQNFCSIDNPTLADLTITGTGIQWYSSSSGGTPLALTTTLTSGSSYYASQTVDGCESALRYEVVVTIADPAAPTGSAAQSFCSIDTPTVGDLTATGTNIQWYDSANGGTPLASGLLLVNGTNYYASQTIAGCESDTRFVVAVTVSDPSRPTGNTTQSFCSINNPTVAELVATGTNIKWYDVATGGTALATTTALSNGASYYASQTVGVCESDTRLTVVVSISDPIAPTGAAAQSFCAVNNPTLNDIEVVGTGIQWYNVATGGTVLASNTQLVSGTTYHASQTIVACESMTRLAVTVTVDNPGAPTGDATQNFCNADNKTINDLIVSGADIKFYASSTGGIELDKGDALMNGTTYYASQTVGGCESAVRLGVTAVVNQTPVTPVLLKDCTNGFDNGIITVTSPVGAGYRYSLNGTDFQDSPVFGGLVNSTYRVTVESPEGCQVQSATLLMDCGCVGGPTLTVTPNNGDTCGITPITISGLTFGGSATQVTSITSDGAGQLDITSSNVSPFDLVYTPDTSDAGKDITITLTTDNPLGDPCKAVSDTFVVTVNTTPITPVPANGGAFTECITVPAQTLDANDLITVPANHSAVWYDALTAGSVVNNPTLNTVGSVTYYVEFVNTNQCVSPNRAPVVLTLNDTAAPTTTSATQTFCGLNLPTVADIAVTGTNIQWYLDATGGTPLPTTELLKDNTTYYASQNDGTCESSQRLAVAINLECGVVVNDDSVSGVDGVNGAIGVLNVLDNDELSGNPVTINDVILTEETADPNGYLTLNPEGSVDVAPGTPLGTYTLTYNLCEQSNPTNCGNQPATVTVIVDVDPTADLQVVYEISNISPEAFEPVQLTITVTNNGPAPATGVQTTNTYQAPDFEGYFYSSHNVTDGSYDHDAGVWSIGDMAVGETMVLTINANVKPTLLNDTFDMYQAVAEISGNETDPDLLNNIDTINIAGLKKTVNLALSLSVVDIEDVDLATATVLPVLHDASSNSTYSPTVGEEITFQLFVENTGSSTATDVELTNILPAGLEYVSHQFFQGTGTMTLDNTKKVGTWTIGDLVSVTQDPSAKSSILLITTKVKGNSNYTEHAEVWSNEELPPDDPNHDPNTDITNNVRELTPVPVPSADVSISKSIVGASPNVTPTPNVGDEIIFRLTAKNAADLSNATGVVVTDKLPSGYTYLKDSSGGEYDEKLDIYTVADYDPKSGLWDVGKLDAITGEAILEITVRVNPNGDYVNIGRIAANEGDPDGNNNESQAESNPNPIADLSLSKAVTAKADGSTEFKLYDEVEYTLTVTNNGPSDAKTIIIDEDFPSQLDFLKSAPSIGTYDPVNHEWSIPGLPADQTGNANVATLKIYGVVNEGDGVKEQKKIVNRISVDSSQVTDNNGNNDSATVEIIYIPDCEIRIYNFVSANGDGKNDYFQIDNIECYTNSIQIFNRWGSLVYEMENYESTDANDKVFKGISRGASVIGSDDLPSGTYFYILKYNDGTEEKEQTGYIQLTR